MDLTEQTELLSTMITIIVPIMILFPILKFILGIFGNGGFGGGSYGGSYDTDSLTPYYYEYDRVCTYCGVIEDTVSEEFKLRDNIETNCIWCGAKYE